MKFLFLIILICEMHSFAIDRELKSKVTDYMKILRACPDSSAVPEAILKQIEQISDEEAKPLILAGLRKEFQLRGSSLINLCRKQAYAQIKQKLDENKEALTTDLNSLRTIKELSEENTSEVAAKLDKLMNSMIPSDISWGEDVKQARSMVGKIGKTLLKFDDQNEPADFATMEFIAKASVCPLLIKNKVALANFQKLSSMPFQVSAAVYQINLIRVLRNQPPLLIDPKLNVVAFKHSKDMKDNNFLAHESPTEGQKTLKDRATKLRTTASEQIIGRGTNDVIKLNKAYLKRYKNAKHYFGPWKRIGVGYYSKHWTQVFGK